MEITWLGHACFKIRSKQGTTVITDPYSPDLGYSLGKPTARIVTVSHQHPGHSYVQGISGEPKVISRPGEYEISRVLIIGLAGFHDAEKGAIRGKNIIYLFDVDGVSVCHAGDLGHTLTVEQIEELGTVDILLLPVGGVTTIGASTAAEVVRQLEPKVVVPMHYKTPALKAELEPVDRFLKEVGVHEANSQTKLSYTKSNLPLSMQVILLSY